jgi:acetolactate synthase-1/2/3 large subunit
VIGATPASGVEFPDFVGVASAYGIRAERIATVADLPRLDELLQHDGPLLIDLMVDPRQGFAPRIKSREDGQGGFITPELDDMFPFLAEDVVKGIRTEAADIRAQPPGT